MAFRKLQTIALTTALLLAGCSFIDNVKQSIFPSDDSVDDTGEVIAPEASGAAPSATAGTSTTTTSSTTVQRPAPTQAAPRPVTTTTTTTTTSAAPAFSQSPATGTLVGQKVVSLRADLGQLQVRLATQTGQNQRIQAQTEQDSEVYHGTVAAISSRLQVGTTPGNPVLLQQWSAAQGELDRINADVQLMNDLGNQVAGTSSLAGYLLDSVRASRTLSGGLDQDFQQLRLIEDQTSATSVGIDRLLSDLAASTQRQQVYVANERGNLNQLALAVQAGQMYSGGSTYTPIAGAAAPISPLAQARAFNAASAGSTTGGPPLVVIRFDRPNVAYQDALYTAVKAALDRKPAAAFDVVAMTPANSGGQSETAARRNAEQVARVLNQMGLPNDRVQISTSSSSSSGPGEVRVFVR